MKKYLLPVLLALAVILVVTASILIVNGSKPAAFSNDPEQIKKASLSVLKLTSLDADGNPIRTGSGFLMFDQTTLVTSYQMIKDASLITAENDEGSRYTASDIKAADEKKDIAILQLTAPADVTPLDYSADPLRQGERVTAIGCPDGLKNTSASGIVSSVFTEDNVRLFQTDIPVPAGGSGWALLNEAGKVIGMAGADRTGGQKTITAVSIAEAAELFDSWDQSVTPLGPKETQIDANLAPEDYVGRTMWDFTVQTAGGGEFTLSESLKTHELAVVNLWATWCPPCRAEFPFLEQAWEQYRDRVDVIALTVEPRDTLDVVARFAEEYGMKFSVGRDEANLFGKLGGMYIPTTLLIGADRKILAVEIGGKPSAEAFTQWFDRYLAK